MVFYWHRTTGFVLFPLRANHIPFCQYLVYLGHRQCYPILFFQEISDLLSTAAPLPLTKIPNLVLDSNRHLANETWFSFALMARFQKGQQTLIRDVANPAIDGVPIGFQTTCDLAVADALFVQFPGKNDLRFLIHVHRFDRRHFLN